MTSSKNKHNNIKNEDKKSPGGGTSNAGNASPANSSFSDGVLLSSGTQDVKPIVTQTSQSVLQGQQFDFDHGSDDRVAAILGTLNEQAAIIGTLNEQEQFDLMTVFASQTGFILTKPNMPRQTQPTMWNNSMATGRENPSDVDSSPNAANFSQRATPPLVGLKPRAPASSTAFHRPAPAGNHQHQPVIPNFSTTPSSSMRRSNSTGNVQSFSIHPTQVSHAGGTPGASTTQPSYIQASNRWTGHSSHPAVLNASNTGGPFGYPTAPTNAGLTHTPVTVVHPPVHNPPVSTLASGISLRSTPRPNNHASYDNDRVIIPRTNRGTTDKDRAKICELCITPLDPKITRGNMTKLLSSDDSYDIAKDAARWQTDLGNIWTHVVQYDFAHIALIPRSFDPSDSTSIDPNGPFINSVLDHDQLSDAHYFDWQSVIRRFGNKQELISDAWLSDKLWSSLDSELRTEVKADFDELPDINKGAISLLRLVINRMVQNNQESR